MTDHIGLTEGDRVWFTGYAPEPPLRCRITQVLRRSDGHPEAGVITGYVLAVDGGGTLCAEPNQLKQVTL